VDFDIELPVLMLMLYEDSMDDVRRNSGWNQRISNRADCLSQHGNGVNERKVTDIERHRTVGPGFCAVRSRSEKLEAFKLLVTGLLETFSLMKLTTVWGALSWDSRYDLMLDDIDFIDWNEFRKFRNDSQSNSGLVRITRGPWAETDINTNKTRDFRQNPSLVSFLNPFWSGLTLHNAEFRASFAHIRYKQKKCSMFFFSRRRKSSYTGSTFREIYPDCQRFF
jgi:hypothetical protein